jgi:hypothetical protein
MTEKHWGLVHSVVPPEIQVETELFGLRKSPIPVIPSLVPMPDRFPLGDDLGPATCRELLTRCSPAGGDNPRGPESGAMGGPCHDIWREQKPHVQPSGVLEKAAEELVRRFCQKDGGTALNTLVVCYCRWVRPNAQTHWFAH